MVIRNIIHYSLNVCRYSSAIVETNRLLRLKTFLLEGLQSKLVGLPHN
jgi:hypothetical protein